MSRPTTLVNTLIEEKREPLDRLSKIFIITELMCGINRLPVFGKIKPTCIAFSLVFSVSINIIIICLSCINVSTGIKEVVRVLKLFQYIMCAILGFALRKNLRDFYFVLNKFDKETGFVRLNKDMIENVVQMLIIVGIMSIILTVLHLAGGLENCGIELLVILLVNITELQYCGHLFSLLIPRLRFINHLMKLSMDDNLSTITIIENKLVGPKDISNTRTDMKHLMDYYHRIIIAFDALNEAIKWQMLIIIVTSFMTSLAVSYTVILHYIRNDYVLVRLLVQSMLAASEMIPMFAPCRVIDAVHGEVRCLIESLSTRLYKNKIEKSSRAVARAFLELMEARDLSYSLLQILHIDVSFPFKFLSLLITYLIILLQFEKVINLDRSTI